MTDLLKSVGELRLNLFLENDVLVFRGSGWARAIAIGAICRTIAGEPVILVRSIDYGSDGAISAIEMREVKFIR